MSTQSIAGHSPTSGAPLLPQCAGCFTPIPVARLYATNFRATRCVPCQQMAGDVAKHNDILVRPRHFRGAVEIEQQERIALIGAQPLSSIIERPGEPTGPAIRTGLFVISDEGRKKCARATKQRHQRRGAHA